MLPDNKPSFMTLPIPGKSLYKLLAVLSTIALATSVWPSLLLFWQLSLVIGGVLLLIDLLFLYRRAIPEVSRTLQTSIPLGVKRIVTLHIQNSSRYPCTMDIYDHFPLQLAATGLPIHLSLAADENASVSYQVIANARGKYHFPGVQLHLYSRWGLWERDYHLPLASNVRVYPNFSAIPHLALLATDNHLSQLGIIKKPRRGQGQDFHPKSEKSNLT